MAETSFEDWIEELFDHQVTKEGWWWDYPIDRPEPDPPCSGATGLEYFRRLCEQVDSWSTPYSEAQLGQGLWHLFDSIAGTVPTPLLDPSLEIDQRVRAVGAIEQLYLKLFEPRCRPELGHLATSGPDDAHWSLNGTCYMLWDISYLYEPWEAQPEAAIEDACLRTLGALLRIRHVACQESALHGLSHWHERHPARTAEIVDKFLADNADLPADLLAYARTARTGGAQ